MHRWLTWQVQAALNSLGKLIRSPFVTLMTCSVIGVALALPALFFVALQHADVIHDPLQQSVQLTLYLKKNTTDVAAMSLAHEIEKRTDVKTVQPISPTAGYKELQQQMGLDDATTKLLGNPLPWAIIVTPAANYQNPAELNQLSQSLKQFQSVDSIQLDRIWAEQMATLIRLAHRITEALSVLLAAAVLLIINNSIRSATEHHQEEIKLIQLIGGTPGFIRRPFLYTGIIYGVAGAVIAWLLVTLFVFVLQEPIQHLASLYDSDFHLHGMNMSQFLILLLVSSGLGFLGSFLAVARKLSG